MKKHSNILKCLVSCLLISSMIMVLSCCMDSQTQTTDTDEDLTNDNSQSSSEGEEVQIDEYDWEIVFKGDSAVFPEESGIEVSENVYKIVKSGTYLISGTLDDGQIQIEVPDTDKVDLLLNNFTGSCSTSAVIYAIKADKITIDLQKDSENVLTDSSNYVFENVENDKPNACIYSSDDLEIKGGGSLVVNARYNNGIGCKNDIEINNGTIIVNAINNAIKGNDSVTICGDAVIDIQSANDGLETQSIEADKGFVTITQEAQVSVSCEDDAIQATKLVTITAGATLTVNKAQQAVNCDGSIKVDAGCLITK